MSEKPAPPPYFALHAALFEAGLAFMAIFLGWVFQQTPWEAIKFDRTGVVLGIVAVLPLVGMLLACRRLHWRPLQAVWGVLDTVVVPLFRGCTWMELAAIALLAGVGEELLFRGLLQTALAQWSGDFLPHTTGGALLGDWIAVIFVAVLFGALHAMNLAYAVLAALMGVYLGWLFLATGNLVVPTIAHGLYDFLALAYVVRRAPHTKV